jgi:hypothetical protein
MRRRQYTWWLVVAGIIVAGLSTVGASGLEPGSSRPLVPPAALPWGAAVTPDPVARPHPVATVEMARALEGGAATSLRLGRSLNEQGRVRLVPGSPGCPTCGGDDLELDLYEDLFRPDLFRPDLFRPFDGPFLGPLRVASPLAVG